jgi:hypothetical protein
MHAGPVSSDAHRRPLCGAFALAAALLLAAPALAQRGAMTVPRNLEQLTDRAADIVRGTVISAHVEKHPQFTNLDMVVVTLRVRETLKGDARGTFQFRQHIWDIRDRWDAAGYRKGQDVLLLMIAPSRYGLSSPAGMTQGRFRIERDRSGHELAVNGSGNIRLFDGIVEAANSKGVTLTARQAALVAKHRGGPVALSELRGMIRAFARVEP